MPNDNLVRYPLGLNGAIHHWLVCGPVQTPLQGLDSIINPMDSPFGLGGRWAISNVPDSLNLKKRAFQELEPPCWQPDTRPELGASGPPEAKTWRYTQSEEDNCIDMSLFNFSISWMQGWSYTRVWVPEFLHVQTELISVGPVQVWLNDQLASEYDDFGYVEPRIIPLKLSLTKGWNDLYLYARMVGWREARMAWGLRILSKHDLEIGLPVGEVSPSAWKQSEESLSALQLRQSTFNDNSLPILLDPEAPNKISFIVETRIPFPSDEIPINLDYFPFPAYTTSEEFTIKPGEELIIPLNSKMLKALTYLPNETALSLKFRPSDGTPFSIERKLYGKINDFACQPFSDYQARRLEALEHLSNMQYHVLGTIAAVQTGQALTINSNAVGVACEFMKKRFDCADFYAIDLLFLLNRYGDHPALSDQDLQRIESAFLGFKLWIDEPGLDAMCFHTENHQILFHVLAYLAGQRWMDRVFTNAGWTGRQQKERARKRITRWIRNRLAGSFSEWDSSTYLTLDAYAMLALVELADSTHLQSMAHTLLDKIYFILACQSFRGVHGSTHGRAYASTLINAHLEKISGIQRLAWGLGAYNGEARSFGPLALARRYQVPNIIQDIGSDLPEQLITRSHSRGRYRPNFDLLRDNWEVNTLTFRTPDGMLSAAQDYLPGIKGWQEHPWQATLSPQAVIFTNQPGNSREDENARPNFWAGSYRLPRVGMVENTLVCLYNLSLSGGMGFTHAYFPTSAFNEFFINGAWALARYKNGYIALASDGNLILTKDGKHAGQELRSEGSSQAWLCHLGNATQYRDFPSFCRQVSRNPFITDKLSVKWQTPQGSSLSFSWDNPFICDGKQVLLKNILHYENIYTQTPLAAKTMKIIKGNQQIILDLAQGKSLSIGK